MRVRETGFTRHLADTIEVTITKSITTELSDVFQTILKRIKNIR